MRTGPWTLFCTKNLQKPYQVLFLSLNFQMLPHKGFLRPQTIPDYFSLRNASQEADGFQESSSNKAMPWVSSLEEPNSQI